jgi:hypothetical protein
VFGSTNPWFAGVNPSINSTISHDGNGVPDVYGLSGNVATPVPSVAVGSAPSFRVDVSGEVRHGPDPVFASDRGADGKSFDVQARINAAGESFGKSGLIAPINALVGVFLPELMSGNTLPATLSFEIDASRNFHKLAPDLGQMFFVGDGRTDDGNVQVFDVPSGTARLWLGVHDAFEWNDNDGSYRVEAIRCRYPRPCPCEWIGPPDRRCVSDKAQTGDDWDGTLMISATFGRARSKRALGTTPVLFNDQASIR